MNGQPAVDCDLLSDDGAHHVLTAIDVQTLRASRIVRDRVPETGSPPPPPAAGARPAA